jgi:formamidopyrimidine-DNA glycosylase
MPELPDVTVYVEALRRRVAGQELRGVVIRGPFLLRTVEPAIESALGRRVEGVERLGKRIVLALASEVFLVIHLMIAGRLRWVEPSGARAPSGGVGKIELARFKFDSGTLVLTEAGTQKRASLHVVAGRDSLRSLHAGGLDVFEVSPAMFIERLRSTPRTLKRALTDPRLVDGIGNAYSDEILHAARLSPVRRVSDLSDADLARLHAAARETLTRWTDRLGREFGLVDAQGGPGAGRFPGAGEITAFRPDFAVHGRFGASCPACGAKVQRIVYAQNECNYCPGCQTGGRILADRSLSRLLNDDWPRTLEELEGGT